MLNYMIVIIPVLFVLVALILTIMQLLSLGQQYHKKFKAIQIKKLKSRHNAYTHKNQSPFVSARTRGSVRQAMNKTKDQEEYYFVEQHLTYP